MAYVGLDEDKAIINCLDPVAGGLLPADDEAVAPRRSFSETSHCLRILQGLNKQRQMGLLCDVTLVVGTVEFACHRNVLSACSPYFMAMFTGDMRERNASRIKIEGVEPVIMKQLIEYTYTSDIHITTDNAQQLLSAANMIQIGSILDACCRFLEKEMHPSNCLGIHCFAEAHACTHLSKKAKTFALENFLEVTKYEEVKQLPETKLIEFIEDSSLRVPCEDTVLQLVIDWVKHNADVREAALPRILGHVRLPLVDPYFLFDKVDQEDVLTRSNDCRALVDEAKKYFILKDRHNHLESTRTRPRHGQQPQHLIFIIGGEIYNKNYLSSVDYYDVDDGTWERLQELPVPRCHHGAAVHEKSTIYIAGGFSKEKVVLSNVLRFEPMLDKWTRVASMNTPRARFGMASLDGYIYAVGGYDGQSRIDSMERYDPKTNVWSYLHAMPVALSRCHAVAYQRFLYVAGGTTDPSNQCVDIFHRYNPLSNAWESLTSMPVPRCLGGLVVTRGKIYAVGGTEELVRASRKLCCYDPIMGSWSECSSMVEARFDAGVAAMDNCLLVLSGHDGANSFYHTMEEYDIDEDKWTVLTSTKLPYGRCRFGCIALTIPKLPKCEYIGKIVHSDY